MKTTTQTTMTMSGVALTSTVPRTRMSLTGSLNVSHPAVISVVVRTTTWVLSSTWNVLK